jgi:molybdenum cofactor guanylyltransferase
MFEPHHFKPLTGLILAGGQASRMGHINKGAQLFKDKSLFEWALNTLEPQVDKILISANQYSPFYEQFSLEVIPDIYTGFSGPLAGIHAGLSICQTEWLLIVPCDSPFFPHNLAAQFIQYAIRHSASVVYAITQDKNGHLQKHPTFTLVHRSLLPSLDAFLKRGDRKMGLWLNENNAKALCIADINALVNINTLSDLNDFTDKLILTECCTHEKK